VAELFAFAVVFNIACAILKYKGFSTNYCQIGRAIKIKFWRSILGKNRHENAPDSYSFRIRIAR
jgi:hypothetical protein